MAKKKRKKRNKINKDLGEKTERVRILETSYEEAIDLIFWKIEILSTKKIAVLSWRRKDFGSYFGINEEIPLPLIKEFCKKMEGQERNLLWEE